MNIIKQRIQESIDVKKRIIENEPLLKTIEEVTLLMIEQIRDGGSIYFAGNGGSAADAQHLAAELSGRFYFDRQPLSADALHCNTSFMTAVANDYSYDIIYARLLSGIGRKGDVLVGLSTSGNSKNIVKAFEKAKEMDIYTIAMTGEGGGKMKELADLSICVPSNDTPRIQESHIMIGHIICEIIESTLFKATNK
ncbi:MAG: D-sedoheptulose 7-phosphate isomerase [Dysgonomonas sp.]